MIRKKKLYKRPMKLYQKSRIEEENALAKKYGLKNKKEIWKTVAKISYYRKRAMGLAKSSREEQEVFFRKLNDKGLKVNSMADVLGLQVEDILRRRLPSVVAQKGLANTVKQARQMVVHKKIIVDNSVVNSPSYIVSVSEENQIRVREKNKSEAVKEAVIMRGAT